MEGKKLQVRMKYYEDWNGRGEHFVLENKMPDEDEWGLGTAYKLFDLKDDQGNVIKEGELLSYEALTKIRDLKKRGIEVRFA